MRTFGILEPIHELVLRAQPLESPRSWFEYAVLPCLPIYAQAYLLISGGSRLVRCTLGVLAIALLIRGWTSWRFTNLELNAFNNGFTIVFIHLAVKAVEFGLLRDRVVDPYTQPPYSRPTHVSAFDICLNSRMLSLGSVGLDHAAGEPNESVVTPKIERHLRHGLRVHRRRGKVAANGHGNGVAKKTLNGTSNGQSNGIAHGHANGATNGIASTDPRPTEVALLPRPRTRSGAIGRHVRHAFTHYAVLDTMLAVLRRIGPDTLAAVHASTQPGLFAQFLNTTGFRVLPALLDWKTTPFAVEFATQCCVPIIIWQALSAGYHVAAALALGTGLWEVQSWDVDLFDAPWKADSLIDLWGKRWHQLFRHQFIIVSATILRVLHLPNTAMTLFPLTFLFSGILHALGELSCHPVPAPIPLASFFLLCGAGCAAEVLFKRVTGHRVHGFLGRVWTWTTMFFAGRIATNAWFDAGIAGNRLLPDWGVGELLAPWLVKYVFTPYRR